jgi:hypothetical protein
MRVQPGLGGKIRKLDHAQIKIFDGNRHCALYPSDEEIPRLARFAMIPPQGFYVHSKHRQRESLVLALPEPAVALTKEI